MPISAGSAAAASVDGAAPVGRRSSPLSRPPGDGKAHRVKLRRVRRFAKKNIKKITGRIVTRGARVVTDGLGCFNSVADAGCTHETIATVSGRKAARHPAFKSAIAATFRSGSKKHALAEFEYRSNRRYDLAAMMPRLAWVAVQTPPMQ